MARPAFDPTAQDGYYYVYVIRRGPNSQMIDYVTPQRTWTTHSYEADVFRTTADLEECFDWVRSLGLTPSCTPSDEQPADPRWHGTQKPSAWRMWK